jgi:hypothetical protein
VHAAVALLFVEAHLEPQVECAVRHCLDRHGADSPGGHAGDVEAERGKGGAVGGGEGGGGCSRDTELLLLVTGIKSMSQFDDPGSRR